MKSKYIIIEYNGEDGVIVFSPFITHQDVAENFKIKSAGNCELKDAEGWVVSGNSVSLNCCPRPQDAEILNRHLLRKWPLHSLKQQIVQNII